MHDGFWNFLDKYGYHYDGDHTRALLPCEVWFLLPFIVTMFKIAKFLILFSVIWMYNTQVTLCLQFPFLCILYIFFWHLYAQFLTWLFLFSIAWWLFVFFIVFWINLYICIFKVSHCIYDNCFYGLSLWLTFPPYLFKVTLRWPLGLWV